MIVINNNFTRKYRRAVRMARTEKIRVVRLRPDLYYVARVAPGHGEYLVRFFHKSEEVTAVCATIYNEPCPSRKKPDQCCAHVAAAVLRGIKYGKAKQRKEAA